MSYRPQSLVDAARYLGEKMAIPQLNFSIRAAKSARGFHAGKAEIFKSGEGNRDYSVKDPRNKAGLSEASSALDIRWPGHLKRLRALTAHLVEQGKAGNLLFEVIGPDSTGKANYWSAKTGWLPKPALAPASHSWHIHLGFWRDTETSDRIAVFRGFFEAAIPVPVEPEEPDTETPDPDPLIEELETENAGLKAAIAAIAALANKVGGLDA